MAQGLFVYEALKIRGEPWGNQLGFDAWADQMHFINPQYQPELVKVMYYPDAAQPLNYLFIHPENTGGILRNDYFPHFSYCGYLRFENLSVE